MAMRYLLQLYVTGQTPHSTKAMENLKQILDKNLKGLYKLKVIDILENPQLAEKNKILVTPTLVRVLPLPVRKFIGNLSDKEKVLLDLILKTG